ncbi:MAG: adenosylcobalamin-dependent ribonucleoside-diphosphate reductase [Candidatus Beckwithbacteria bacterium]|nr:adenosylcobalamin-dependent ribonucleoside-diphosphate reductase [Candidatus Beckwithbacteria bacterium]
MHSVMKIIEPKQSAMALEITRKRYLMTDRKGRPIETTGEMLWRVAQHMAKFEEDRKIAEAFYERMVEKKFVCSGKAMFEAGNPGGTGQLAACFVLPIEDSIDSIFKTLGEAAVIHKNNGGTGFNFSKIRPHGDKVKNVPGAASGPVDFIKAFSAALSKILQGAKRQGANIAILNADHPDIEEFIKMKIEDGTIKNFNVSVGATDGFMKAVLNKKPWRLINPRTKEAVKTIRADKLFELICQLTWQTADPGMAFLDRMERDNPTPTLGKIEATNPCGEIPLLAYESCNLGSINLSEHLKNGVVDWTELKKTVHLGVRFLDNMIEVNYYPLEAVERMVKDGNRRIGLGVMGFSHLLYKLGIAYNSEAAVKLAEKVAKFIRQEADKATEQLGKERGNFGNYDVSIYAGSGKNRRNCATTMIAPTGTISMFADCSSGVEPVFALTTTRKTFFEDSRKNSSTKEMTMVDPAYQEYKNKYDKNVFVTAHEIGWQWHVKVQAAWQKYFDNSVSKTINFPKTATVDEVKKAYLTAWKLGCKGITVYRDGSKDDQVLNKSVPPAGGCPECGEELEIKEGCQTCRNCGFSKCSL